MSNLKCKDCKYYEVIKSARNRNPEHGWCTVRSVYPAVEELGQVFPPNVARMDDPAKPAKPYIVKGNGVVSFCTKGQAKG